MVSRRMIEKRGTDMRHKNRTGKSLEDFVRTDAHPARSATTPQAAQIHGCHASRRTKM